MILIMYKKYKLNWYFYKILELLKIKKYKIKLNLK